MIFDFFIGGFFGNSLSLVLKGEDLLCYEYVSVLTDLDTPAVIHLKENKQWQNVLDFLKECNWKRRYTSPILDGEQWSLVAISDSFHIKSDGSNAYPEDFDVFLNLLKKLIGIDIRN